ncbi:hypothetical protein JOQ06_002157, partial [Pogonophryne albipinna]
AGPAKVQRSTSTTAPGCTSRVTTCAGCSPLSCCLSSSVSLQRALCLMDSANPSIFIYTCLQLWPSWLASPLLSTIITSRPPTSPNYY